MDAFFEMFRNLCLVSVGIVMFILFVRFVLAGSQTIDEGQAAVIERWGKFARIAGPGQIWVTPEWERVARVVETRTVGEVFRFADVWFRGFLPVNIELALSYNLNLTNLPNRKQKELAYYTRDEWKTLTRAQISRVLQDVVSTFEFGHLIGAEGKYRNEFEANLASNLNSRLGSLGMVLNEDNGVTLKAVLLPDEIRDSLMKITRTDIDVHTRGTVIENLMRKYPGLSEGFIISVASMITGQEFGSSQLMPTLLFGGGGARQVGTPPKIIEEKPSPPLLDNPDDEIWRVLKLPRGKGEENSSND